jgi:tRNA(Ile)-lysidine synthase
MSEKLERAAKSILIQAGIIPESKVIIGVSGGPDSLALLHIMCRIMSSGCLWVAHLNHGLRSEADDEAEFVARVADSWGLAFRSKKVDVGRLAHRQGWSVEEAGRKARYLFLANLAEEVQAKATVVAHNADDQAETVLLHLLRGSGLKGLRGMRPESSLPGAPDIKLVRPFLTITREEIETYCRSHDLRPMLDSTNVDPAYLRNRLRHELLPLLVDFNPQVKQHLLQMAELIAADEALLDELGDQAWQEILAENEVEWLRLDLAKWRSLPLSLRRRTLRRALAELRPSITDISFRTIDLAHQVGMEKETGAEATLPGRITLRLEYEHLLLAADLEQVPLDQPQLPLGKPQILPIPGSVALDGEWLLTATVSDLELLEVRNNRDPWLAFFDIGQKSVLHVRSRMPGEQFQPLGMDGRSASVQDVMVNRKLPASLRDRWPIVVTEKHPLWLVGLQTDERGKVTDRSRRIIQLCCHR